ncbi:MAG: IS1634 family transposase [Gammaproteobacteria bacterium]|nr:IS1634 family transposase [Gammaproteobacteria bacterium]
MYVRVKTTKNSPRKSVQIVRSQRLHGRVQQSIVRHLGIAQDDDHLDELKRLGERLIIEMEIFGDAQALHAPRELQRQLQEAVAAAEKKRRKPRLVVDLSQWREESRVVRGFHEVYGPLYELLGLSQVLPKQDCPVSSKVLREVVLARLAQPRSKRAVVRYLTEQMGLRVSLEQVYRMMDQLTPERIETLQRLATQATLDLHPDPVDVYFFDCTTVYFESFVQDELRAPGYSKDGKVQESQVLLAIMVTSEGLPLRYELLPGQTFEGHSLRAVLRRFREHVPIRRAIVVADRGMWSQENLAALQKHDLDYIVGAPLRRETRAFQEQILQAQSYTKFNTNTDHPARIAEFPLADGDRLVVHWSTKRAKKDAKQRERQVAKLRQKCQRHRQPEAFLSQRGYGRFLRIEGSGPVVIDEAKIDQAARWDGLYGVRTSVADLPAAEIFHAYRGLWQVEQTFRVTKHDLKVRPIHHWTARRINAHIAIVFMTLTCARHLEHRCRVRYRNLSPAEIHHSLAAMQQSVLWDLDTKKRYAVPSAPSVHAKGICQALDLKIRTQPFPIH